MSKKPATMAARKLLPELADGRTRTARRYQTLIAEMVSDAGGAELLPATKLQLIRRAASLMLLCEMAEHDLVAGKAIDAERSPNGIRAS
jgi:hypothetical protein